MGQIFSTAEHPEEVELEELGLTGMDWEYLTPSVIPQCFRVNNFVETGIERFEPQAALAASLAEREDSEEQAIGSELRLAQMRVKYLEEQRSLRRREYLELLSLYREAQEGRNIAQEKFNRVCDQNRQLRQYIQMLKQKETLWERF